MKSDIYQKVTDKIIAGPEKGELTWLKPWSAGNMDGRITKPLRHNGLPYSGINVLMLWGAAMEGGYLSPYWITFKQAAELGAHVRKGERGNPVVYASTITRTEETEEQDDGREEERSIPFMKAYTVFNVEQIDGLPAHYYVRPEPVVDRRSGSNMPRRSLRRPALISATAAIRLTTAAEPIMCRCLFSRASAAPKPIARPCCTS